MKTSIRLEDEDIVKIDLTLKECIKNCPNEGFVKQTKELLEKYEAAMAKAGFVNAKIVKI